MTPLETLPLGIDARDALLIDRLHGNLPLTEHPFAVVAPSSAWMKTRSSIACAACSRKAC